MHLVLHIPEVYWFGGPGLSADQPRRIASEKVNLELFAAGGSASNPDTHPRWAMRVWGGVQIPLHGAIGHRHDRLSGLIHEYDRAA